MIRRVLALALFFFPFNLIAQQSSFYVDPITPLRAPTKVQYQLIAMNNNGSALVKRYRDSDSSDRETRYYIVRKPRSAIRVTSHSDEVAWTVTDAGQVLVTNSKCEARVLNSVGKTLRRFGPFGSRCLVVEANMNSSGVVALLVQDGTSDGRVTGSISPRLILISNKRQRRISGFGVESLNDISLVQLLDVGDAVVRVCKGECAYQRYGFNANRDRSVTFDADVEHESTTRSGRAFFSKRKTTRYSDDLKDSDGNSLPVSDDYQGSIDYEKRCYALYSSPDPFTVVPSPYGIGAEELCTIDYGDEGHAPGGVSVLTSPNGRFLLYVQQQNWASKPVGSLISVVNAPSSVQVPSYLSEVMHVVRPDEDDILSVQGVNDRGVVFVSSQLNERIYLLSRKAR